MVVTKETRTSFICQGGMNMPITDLLWSFVFRNKKGF